MLDSTVSRILVALLICGIITYIYMQINHWLCMREFYITLMQLKKTTEQLSSAVMPMVMGQAGGAPPMVKPAPFMAYPYRTT